MTKIIFAIDPQGFMTYETIEIKPIGTNEEDNPVYVIPDGYVGVPLPTDEQGKQLPFWRPKWTGLEWVEDKTQEEFDEEALLNSLIPTQDELADADLEIKVLTLLMEMEVI